MSTTSPESVGGRLIDDAAVFPPGNAPVPLAWSEHRVLREAKYGNLVGPLLIGAKGVPALVDAAAHDPTPISDPVAVGVIARSGLPVDDLIAAVTALRSSPHLHMTSVEVAAPSQWRRALEFGVPVAVEVTRTPAEQAVALDEIAQAAGDTDPEGTVIAKLRTQSTASSPVPTARELARFLHGVRERGLSFKLTGGLHRAVAHTVPLPAGRSEDQHGVLNVLLATHQLEVGAALPELEAVLEFRDGLALAANARALDKEAVAAARARFVSFGCCGVMDPINDLVELGVLPG